jgi:4-hydroxybenzoate polyprenyltransferase
MPLMGSLYFTLMVTATILIAAAGYIGNDYFDVATDRINKPDKQYIGNQISPASALAASILLSMVSVILAVWLTILIKSWLPATLLIVALMVAWWYAVRLKKSFVWGNVAVACMSAGTIAMAWLIEKQFSGIDDEPSSIITRIITAISIFAFLLSLMREIVKDIEDMEGDRLIGCRSLPLKKGIPFTKTILFVFAAVTFVLLASSQLYLMQYSRIVAVFWLLAAVEIPLLYFVKMLVASNSKADFHYLSSLLKWIMVSGMASTVAAQF